MESEELSQTRKILGVVIFSCTGGALEVPAGSAVHCLVAAFRLLMNYLLMQTFDQLFGHYHYLAHPSHLGVCYKSCVCGMGGESQTVECSQDYGGTEGKGRSQGPRPVTVLQQVGVAVVMLNTSVQYTSCAAPNTAAPLELCWLVEKGHQVTSDEGKLCYL